MKSFPTNLAAEKDKKVGASPVWILKCPFASGTVYLSDQIFTITGWDGGITTKSWINSWGQIDEDIAGDMASPRVSDMLLKAINDPNDVNNIEAILGNASNNIETTDCELYLWFLGLDASTDPPQKMWVGNIVDWEKMDELLYDLELVDQSVRVDKYVGTKIDKDTYPNADPDDIGRIGNIGYGVVKKVPVRAIVAGALDYIDIAIDAVQTTLDLVDASAFPSTGTIGIEDEEITYTGKTSNQLTGLARGANGTTAATHAADAAVWEIITDFIYQAFDHPIKQFGDVYVQGLKSLLKITSVCTLYTGQTGSQHPTYNNKAIVEIPWDILKSVAITLLTDDNGVNATDATNAINTIAGTNVTISDVLEVLNNIEVNDDIAVNSNDSIDLYNTNSSLPYSKRLTANGWGQTVSSGNENSFNPNIDFNQSQNGYRDEHYWSVTVSDLGTTGYFRIQVKAYQTSYTTVYEVVNGVVTINLGSPYTKENSQNAPFGNYGSFYVNAGNGWDGDIIATLSQVKIYFYEYTQQLNKTGSALGTFAGKRTIAMTGNSSADAIVADKVLIDAQCYEDDASGTITGTPNALIEQPDHVFKHFLNTYASWPVADFYTDADTQFATKGYKFAGVINDYKKLKAWLRILAFQCRCYFRFHAGQAQLLWRPDSITSGKTIAASMIRMKEDSKTTMRVKRSALHEVINKLSIHYDRDWTKTGGYEEAYKEMSKTSDSASITRYGEKEKPELFFFDFVVDQAMADDLRDFYLIRYKDRKKLVPMEVFLDNSELEFADGVTLAPLSNLLCEVQKVNIHPGSGRDMRNDRITLVAREY